MTLLPADSNSTLRAAVAALSDALRATDAVAGQGLCSAEGWGDDHSGLVPLFRKAEKMPYELGILDTPRIEGPRGAARVALVVGGRPRSDIWLIFEQDSEDRWKCLALTESTALANLFVTRTLDRFPRWESLAPDEAVRQLGEQVVRAVGTDAVPPKHASVAAWTALTASADSQGLDLQVGRVAALPEIDRAAFQLCFTDPSDNFLVEERWGIVERTGPDSPWVLRQCAHLGTISALLDGIEVP